MANQRNRARSRSLETEEQLVDRLRTETPLVATGRVHLNNAGASPMPLPVLATVREYFDFESEVGGYEAADLRSSEMANVYASVGRLIGAAAENVAVVENATVAVAQALSAFDFEPGDVIVTSRCDYVSNQLMYLSLARRRGVVLERAADLAEGGVDPDSVRALVQAHRPKLVALTHVPTNTGLVQDVEAVGALCRELEVPYLVDACQSVGQMDVDVERIGCDFLAATARKFLRGPRGVGFLYVSSRVLERGLAPLFIDLAGAEWTGPDDYALSPSARRFENWEFHYAIVLGLGAAADYALACGVDRLGRRASGMARALRERLGAIDGVRVLDRGSRLSAIVSFTIDLPSTQKLDWVGVLRERGIHTSAISRSGALIDLYGKGAGWGIRVSPHAFNTEDELEQFLGALTETIDSLR